MQNDTTQTQPLPTTGTIDVRIGPLAFEGVSRQGERDQSL
jgi:hypothetical protein